MQRELDSNFKLNSEPEWSESCKQLELQLELEL